MSAWVLFGFMCGTALGYAASWLTLPKPIKPALKNRPNKPKGSPPGKIA